MTPGFHLDGQAPKRLSMTMKRTLRGLLSSNFQALGIGPEEAIGALLPSSPASPGCQSSQLLYPRPYSGSCEATPKLLAKASSPRPSVQNATVDPEPGPGSRGNVELHDLPPDSVTDSRFLPYPRCSLLRTQR